MAATMSPPRTAYLLVFGVVGAGAAILLVHFSEIGLWSRDEVLSWLGLSAAIAISEQFPIPVRHGTETENFSVTDAFLTAGLMLLPPDVLVASIFAGVVAGQMMQGWAIHKVAFNAGHHLIGISAAHLLYSAASPGSLHDVGSWVAIAAGMLAFFLVNESAVACVIALFDRKSFGAVLFPTLNLSLLHWAGNIAIGILGAAVWTLQPLGAILLLIPLALSFLAYRGWLQSGMERDQMDQIARLAESITSQGDLTSKISITNQSDAVGRLAATFNGMLARLEKGFRRERLFINETSHELRAPIAISRGWLEVLGPNPSRTDTQEAVDIVLDELIRMERIVEDMTTLARIEDEQSLRKESMALDRFVRLVVGKAAHLADGRLSILEIPKGPPLTGDIQRLTQALINMINNAAVHTTRDSKIELRVVGEQDAWRFEVADQGAGLQAGEEESVFLPFRRGNTEASGTGLGLAIVRGVAEAHGGSAGVENRPGRGATFWIRIPR